MKTLVEFIIERQREFPHATGEFTRLIHDITIAAKIVNHQINRAGLAGILGYHGDTNVQGERQKKLDVFANDQFIAALKGGGECCAIASEENENLITFDHDMYQQGKYVVAIDPLDGSSNIEANVSIGTVFSIYKRISVSGVGVESDLLQKGTSLLAAGYIIYGSSTMLVFSSGQGVNGFTLDPSTGIFFLSHPDMHYPEVGRICSVNEANFIYFPEGMRRYIDYCHEDDPTTNRPYISRYIGSMVADIHRNLINGGIFLYPGTVKNPQGKLRLLYECNPMAFIAEQAGGKASDGFRRILEIQPKSLHERAPVIIGPKDMVEKAEEFMRQYSPEFKLD
jgi:fructose-1,6-bisphosphatase I